MNDQLLTSKPVGEGCQLFHVKDTAQILEAEEAAMKVFCL